MNKKFDFLALLLFHLQIIAIPSLDQLALKFGTDKSSKWHNYTKQYEQYLKTIRDKPIVFLEIGFGSGNSTYMWEAYFSCAEIHVIDINNDNRFEKFGKNLSSHCFLHTADQSDPVQLKRVMEKIGKEIDVLIDDGGHTMKQQFISFTELFPYIKLGGLYIIEDLHTSYNEIYFDLPNKQTLIKYLKDLIDDVNYVGRVSGLADKKKFATSDYKNYYQRYIESMHFYNSLCFVFKADGAT